MTPAGGSIEFAVGFGFVVLQR